MRSVVQSIRINKTVDDAHGFNAYVKSFGRVLNHGSLIAGSTKPLKPTSVISYSSSVELDVVFRTVRLNIDELGTLLQTFKVHVSRSHVMNLFLFFFATYASYVLTAFCS